MAFHVPNGGYRRKIEAVNLKRAGVVAGMPDLCLIRDGRAFFLEMKAEGRGLSENQRACHARLRECGAVVMVADGFGEAIAALESMGLLPKGRR
jgi:hypothetical protein